MDLSLWIRKRRDEVEQRWRNNDLSYRDALAALGQLGYSVDQSVRFLEQLW